MTAPSNRLPQIIRPGTDLAEAWNRLLEFGYAQVANPYNQPFIVVDEAMKSDVLTLGDIGVLTCASTPDNGLEVQLINDQPGGVAPGAAAGGVAAQPGYEPEVSPSVRAVAKPTQFA